MKNCSKYFSSLNRRWVTYQMHGITHDLVNMHIKRLNPFTKNNCCLNICIYKLLWIQHEQSVSNASNAWNYLCCELHAYWIFRSFYGQKRLSKQLFSQSILTLVWKTEMYTNPILLSMHILWLIHFPDKDGLIIVFSILFTYVLKNKHFFECLYCWTITYHL